MSAALAESLAQLRLRGNGPAPLLRAAVRTASRAADEAEIAALEGRDVAARRALLAELSAARAEIAAARTGLRARVAAERDAVLARESGAAPDGAAAGAGAAAQAARDINDGLRRATAVLSGELERSRAAGNVVDSSGRTLVATLRRQRDYGGTLKDGVGVLRDLKRAERRANAALALSLFIFFAVVVYVARKRVVNSNTAFFLVRPAARVAAIPIRVSRALFRAVRGVSRLRNESARLAPREKGNVGRLLSPDKAAQRGKTVDTDAAAGDEAAASSALNGARDEKAVL